MRRSSMLVLSLFALAGCDGGEASTGGGAGGEGGTGGGGAGELSVTFGSVAVAPGEEHTRCVVKRLGNTAPIHVDRISNSLGGGSHHLIVYRSGEAVEQPEPFDCQPFTNLLKPDEGIPLVISQADDTLQLPAGVGFALEEAQMVRLEMHYINYTSEPIEVTATSTFHPMDEADFEQEAELAFFAETAVDLPPQSEVTTDPLFIPVPEQLSGAKFFAFTGHQHRLGTGIQVESAESAGGAGTVLYDPEGFSWAEPPTTYHDPPVEVAPGGGFRFQCAWKNTTAEQVTFGDSANDEMCLFYTYYYPSKGPVACAHTDKIGGGATFCCPGDPICEMLP